MKATTNGSSKRFSPNEATEPSSVRTLGESYRARPIASASPTATGKRPSDLKERARSFRPSAVRQSRAQTAGPAPFGRGADTESNTLSWGVGNEQGDGLACSGARRALPGGNTLTSKSSDTNEASRASRRTSLIDVPSAPPSGVGEDANAADSKVRKSRVQVGSVTRSPPGSVPTFSTTVRSKQSSMVGQSFEQQKASTGNSPPAVPPQAPTAHGLQRGNQSRSTGTLAQSRGNRSFINRRSAEDVKRRSTAAAPPDRVHQSRQSHASNRTAEQNGTDDSQIKLGEAEGQQDDGDETDGEEDEEEDETWLGERTQRRARSPSIKTEQELEERYQMQGQGKRRGFCYQTNEPRESRRGDVNFGPMALEHARAMAEMEAHNSRASSRKGTVQQKPPPALAQLQQMPNLELLPSVTDAVDQWDDAHLRSYIANLKPPIKAFYEKFKKRRIDELRVAIFRGMEDETEKLNARGVFEPVNALRVRVKTHNAWHYALRHHRVRIHRESLKEALRLPAARYSKPEDFAETSLPARLFDLVTRPEPLSEECPKIEIFPVYKMMADWLRRSALPL